MKDYFRGETADRLFKELVEERKWIPCKERMPEVGKEVLVTLIDSNGIRCVDVDSFDRFEKHCEWWHYDERVIAWMPLPEPYRE